MLFYLSGLTLDNNILLTTSPSDIFSSSNRTCFTSNYDQGDGLQDSDTQNRDLTVKLNPALYYMKVSRTVTWKYDELISWSDAILQTIITVNLHSRRLWRSTKMLTNLFNDWKVKYRGAGCMNLSPHEINTLTKRFNVPWDVYWTYFVEFYFVKGN